MAIFNSYVTNYQRVLGLYLAMLFFSGGNMDENPLRSSFNVEVLDD